MKSIKLVIIGDGAVGKTCLVMTYANNKFPVEYVPTVFDNYSVNIKVGDTVVELGLWEVLNREESDRLRPLSYPHTSIFLICFSVVNSYSLENVSNKWFPEIDHHCKNVPFILVGTKADLRNSQDLNITEHIVSTESAQEVAKKLGAVTYMEVSALEGTNVKQLFDEAVNAVLIQKTDFKPKQTKGCILS